MRLLKKSNKCFDIIVEEGDELEIHTLKNCKQIVNIKCMYGKVFIDKLSPTFLDKIKKKIVF